MVTAGNLRPMNKYVSLALLAVLTLAAAGLWLNAQKSASVAPSSAPSYRAHVVDPDLTGLAVDPASGGFWAWGSDGAISHSANGEQWQQADTPVTADIVQLVSDGEGGAVAVGHQGALLYATEGGSRWLQAEVIDNPECTLDLFDVLYLAQRQLWLAVGEDGHLLHSSDGGRRWTVSRIDTTDDLLALSLSPDGQLLLGGENGLVGRSADFESWQLLRAEMETPVTGFHYVDDLIIGTSAWGRLLTSRDKGHTWQLLEVSEKLYFNDVAQDPVTGAIVITSHTGQILRSENSGDSWQLVRATGQAKNSYLGDVWYDSPSASLVAFGHHGIIVSSKDGGASWTPVATPFGDSFNRVVFHREMGSYFGVGPRGFKAAASGIDQWQVIQPGFDYYWRQVLTTGADKILIAGSLGKMLLSQDRGESWHYLPIQYPDPRTPPTYRTLQSFPGGPILAAGPTGLIMQATDATDDWEAVHHTAFEQGEAFTHLVLDKERGAAFAIEAFGGIYFSADKGETWRRHAINDERNLWHGSLLKRKHKPGIGIAVGQQGLLLVSADGGESWRTVQQEDLPQVDWYGSYASSRHDTLWVLGEGGTMMRSTDVGHSWQSIESGVSANLRRMLEHPSTGTLVAFGEDGAITRSDDGGAQWSSVPTGFAQELRQGLIEPGTGHMLIVGQGGIILRSKDAGLSWEQLESHTQASFRSGAFTSHGGELIVVGERIVRLVATEN